MASFSKLGLFKCKNVFEKTGPGLNKSSIYLASRWGKYLSKNEPPRNELLPFKSLLFKFLAPVHAPNEKRPWLETGWLETGWLASASSHKVYLDG